MRVDWLSERARFEPTKIAVLDPENFAEYSYGQLNKRAEKMAIYLQKLGVVAGDRVTLVAPNHMAYLDLFFACAKLGAIFVPIGWKLHRHEIGKIIQNAQPKVIFQIDLLASKVQEETCDCKRIFNWDSDKYSKHLAKMNYVNFKAQDMPIATTAMMIYTSGTTGNPKGAMISHRHIWANIIHTIAGWGINQHSSTVTTSPMYHIAGIGGLVLPILWAGGQLVLQANFEASQTVDYIEYYQPSHIFMVPTMYNSLLAADNFAPEKMDSVDLFVSGGAPASKQVIKQFQQMALPLMNSYGLTEAGPNNFYLSPNKVGNKPDSVGAPLPFIDIKLVDDDGKTVRPGEEGEILIGGRHTFDGYWQNKEKTAKSLVAGYVRTGDYAWQDEDGDYFIVGRKSDMIITGGENVFPQEIEQVLLKLPEVADAVVVGYEDDFWGEAIGAGLILADQIDEDEFEKNLKPYLKDHLSSHKIPKQFQILDEFPQTAIGKLDRKSLKEQFNGKKKDQIMSAI